MLPWVYLRQKHLKSEIKEKNVHQFHEAKAKELERLAHRSVQKLNAKEEIQDDSIISGGRFVHTIKRKIPYTETYGAKFLARDRKMFI